MVPKIIDMFFCNCLSHALSCNYDNENDLLDISFWQIGHHKQKLSFFVRLKLAIKFLITGEVFSDMVCLDKKQRIMLNDYLNNLKSIND